MRFVAEKKRCRLLAAALEVPALMFTTGGAAEWFSQTSPYNYGNSTAQSGAIGDRDRQSFLTTGGHILR